MAPKLLFILFLGIVSASLATIVKKCKGVDEKKCSVTDVHIDPCEGNVCVIQLGHSAAISFIFIPNFSASKLVSGAYYRGVRFAGMDSDGCNYTGCPVEAGKPQTFNFTLEIGKKNPPGTYQTAWKLWNEDNESDECCFVTKIKLVK